MKCYWWRMKIPTNTFKVFMANALYSSFWFCLKLFMSSYCTAWFACFHIHRYRCHIEINCLQFGIVVSCCGVRKGPTKCFCTMKWKWRFILSTTDIKLKLVWYVKNYIIKPKIEKSKPESLLRSNFFVFLYQQDIAIWYPKHNI